MSKLTESTTNLQSILETVNNLPEAVEDVEQAVPEISIDSAGIIIATATQEAGKVAAGTTSATQQLTSQPETTFTPTTTDQTIEAGVYITGVQTIKGDANLLSKNILSGITVFGIEGTAVNVNEIPSAEEASF